MPSSLVDIIRDNSQQIAELTRRLTVVEGQLEAYRRRSYRSSLESDRTPPTHTSNVKTAPTHSLPGRDSVRQPNETDYSLTETLGIAETSEVATPSPNYIYYRIYSDDGAIPSKTLVTPSDPFLGRIKARYVPPPRNVKAVKRSIENVENIKHHERTSLFLTPYSESPMDDSDLFTIHNHGTGPGSKPQEPLAFVSKMSDSERTALRSDGRGGLTSTAKSETTPPDIRHVYYVVYADDYPMPSNVAFDPEEPFVGRIRADTVTPPHSLTSIKQCISRVERNRALSSLYANLFADTSRETLLKEGHISLRTDGPGLSPNEPMAIVLAPPIPGPEDGKYIIKNRAADISSYWCAQFDPMKEVYFSPKTMKYAHWQDRSWYHWDIAHDTNGNISMRSPYAPSSWAGADLTGSTVPVPWRLIPADSEFYYLTTDLNLDSWNPRVPAALPAHLFSNYASGTMATLKEDDYWQLWEFIRI